MGKERLNTEYICMVCKGPLGYTPQFCCNAYDCGCQGKPVEPPICSKECYEKWEQGTPEERKQYLENVGL